MKIEVNLNRQAIAKGYLKFLKYLGYTLMGTIVAGIIILYIGLLWSAHWSLPFLALFGVLAICAAFWAKKHQYTPEERTVRKNRGYY